LLAGLAEAGLVFDIVELERETQAAVFWRWFLGTIWTLTNSAVS
jgi:hypothetical protein